MNYDPEEDYHSEKFWEIIERNNQRQKEIKTTKKLASIFKDSSKKLTAKGNKKVNEKNIM
ncbi:MAG: hypothetical protein ABSD71_13340 [Bacteroidales bacterium]|jgi:hypothetical protein